MIEFIAKHMARGIEEDETGRRYSVNEMIRVMSVWVRANRNR